MSGYDNEKNNLSLIYLLKEECVILKGALQAAGPQSHDCCELQVGQDNLPRVAKSIIGHGTYFAFQISKFLEETNAYLQLANFL